MKNFTLTGLIVLVCIFTSQKSYSQNYTVFLSPGFSFSHSFGENGGFTFGVEISLVFVDADIGQCFGAVTSFKTNKNIQSIHVGAEYMYWAGIECGPTFTFERNSNKNYTGLSVTGFLSAIALAPYYTYVFNFKNIDNSDVGSYLKFPIFIGGERLRF